MTQRSPKWMSVEAAQSVLLRFGPIQRTETVGLEDSIQRVTSQPIFAPESIPAFDRSQMDGYAVVSLDVAPASEAAPVFLSQIGVVEMGTFATQSIQSGQTMAVATGAMVPAGADAVVMQEHTYTGETGRIGVLRPAMKHQYVLRKGEDLPSGMELLSANHRVSLTDVGALAACGVTELMVYAKPKVAILSTGDELISSSERPLPGQVRDTNAITLAAQVRESGGLPLFVGRVGDNLAALRQATQQALETADMVLLSGGSSVGLRDHTAELLQQLAQADLLIQGIAIQPGKPTLLADVAGIPVFGMPGNPVSSFVIFYLFVRPLLVRMAGVLRPLQPNRLHGMLTDSVTGVAGRETWVRIRLERQPEEVWITPMLGPSASYRTLLKSDGLLRIPIEQSGFRQGDRVEVVLF